ncbi:MAG: exo-alpha-sialidase [Candidatus Heimdallarchaeota archaeon]|nr:exo-alpha-sialidase [Candidatus Heimdallarchaeota archaeon]MBY8995302.1 exo-alpha-sialidase [Candidatus Heimdallarchaeota archaeon]
MATSAGPTETNEEPFISSFSENVLLSTEDLPYPHHVEPTIAIGPNDQIFAGWKNAEGHNTGGIRVAFTKSVDFGETWSTPEYMPFYSGFLTGQSDPWLVYADGHLYYAYLEYTRTATPLSHITVASSTNNGDTWTRVNATGGVGFADKETMTVDNAGNIYVVYDDIDQVNGTTYVRLTQSADNGQSFDEISLIADSDSDPIDHLGPYVTTDSLNDVYVAWLWWTLDDTWGDVYVARSVDQGLSFSTPVDINADSENGTFTVSPDLRPMKGTLPVIRFDSNDRLYCLWAELIDNDRSWGTFLRYSDDYGLTWSDRYTINQIVAGNQWQPDMDVDSQNRLHFVYYDQQGNYFKPYYRMGYFNDSITTTLTITDALPISDVGTSNVFTRPGDYFMVRVDSKDIPHVVWSDGRDNEMDIYYSHGIVPSTSSGSITSTNVGIPVGTIVMVAVIIFITRKRRAN